MSTTTELDIARRFSEDIGVILQLSPNKDCVDAYFDCYWLSDYPQESERLIFKATGLQVCDIQRFHKMRPQIHSDYIHAFTLFSNIFDGNFFILNLVGNTTKYEEMLIKVIGIQTVQPSVDDIDIPIYVQQLFYHLVHSVKHRTEPIYINLSQYNSLRNCSKVQLISFETEQKRTALSAFETSVLNISNNTDSPQAIFERLKEITNDIYLKENIAKYGKLKSIRPRDKLLFSANGAVDFLKELGFEYTKAKSYLVCDNKPSVTSFTEACAAFNIYNPHRIVLSSFVNTFMQVQDIRCYQQFVWVLDSQQINKLQSGQKDKTVESQQQFWYKVSETAKIKLKFKIHNISEHGYTTFSVIIDSLVSKALSGKFCVKVDELKWCTNGRTFEDLSEGQYYNISFFKESLFISKDVHSLTLKIAIYLQ